MLVYLNEFVGEAWYLAAAMAPYLLLGFLLAGGCAQLLPRDFIRRHLAGNGLKPVLKAVVLGVPLPVCSCGVIPLAASLRKQGASPGATAAFAATTPQTGVDSIAATWSLMGLPFTLARVIANVVCGVLAGALINRFGQARAGQASAEKASGNGGCCGSQESPVPSGGAVTEPSEESSCCGAEPPRETSCCGGSEAKKQSCCAETPRPLWARILEEALVTLPRDLAGWILLGIALGGLIAALVPADALQGLSSNPWLAYGAITLVAVPLYVCATGSIPLAFSLLGAGLSPGAAMVFLIAGPATNTATIATLTSIIGRRETVIYLVVLVVTSWLAGALFDAWAMTSPAGHGLHGHASSLQWWHHASGVGLLAVLGLALWRKWRPAPSKGSSCCGKG